MFIQKPILLGLLFILGVIFVPTPQRPMECGGGSVVWDSRKPLDNAKYLEQMILNDLQVRKSDTYDKKLKDLYWNELGGGPVIFCQKFGKYNSRTWVFDGDDPNAKIIETKSLGVF